MKPATRSTFPSSEGPAVVRQLRDPAQLKTSAPAAKCDCAGIRRDGFDRVQLTATAPAVTELENRDVTFTGGGVSSKMTVTGYTIIDPDTTDMQQLIVFSKMKKYRFQEVDDGQFDQVTTAKGSMTIFSQASQWYDDDDISHVDIGAAKGSNTSQTVNGHLWSVPAKFTWTGRSVYPSTTTGDTIYEESSGTFSIDKTATATCNSFGDDPETAAHRLSQQFILKGYTEQ